MSTKKVTKADNFKALLTIVESANRPDLIDFINHELALLAKKSTSRKPSKSKTVSNALRDVVFEVLSNASTPMTIADIQAADDRLTVYDGERVSNQRISAILTCLINGGIVENTVVKKKNYYAIKGINGTEVSAE